MQALLQASGLHVQYPGSQGKAIHALNGACLELRQGEVLGLLGESGSGKSTIAKTLLRLLPATAQLTGDRIEFQGRDLLKLREQEMQKVRGAQIAMIWQDPGQALNPVMKVGDQVTEVMLAHRGWNSRRCRDESEILLGRVQLENPERRIYDAYPHQLSGGQQQRVAIAQSLACEPSLVIADEPTSSLDPETEDEILHLLRAFTAQRKVSLLLITHDPKILIGLASRVAVMYGGRVIEEGPLEQVFQRPNHPYTQALLNCVPPPPGEPKPKSQMGLPTIPGSALDPESVSTGCAFAPRCSQRMEICEVRRPFPVDVEDTSRVECFLHGG